ncbi:hypothetical protein PEC18_05065 [Paucibacter sp. O1-1]|nr:hypothetical protein [Paucibacter sp. O1-1]MDA3825240.1 hypothetical protein [Paucibacter sp. O1-1]
MHHFAIRDFGLIRHHHHPCLAFFRELVWRGRAPSVRNERKAGQGRAQSPVVHDLSFRRHRGGVAHFAHKTLRRLTLATCMALTACGGGDPEPEKQIGPPDCKARPELCA